MIAADGQPGLGAHGRTDGALRQFAGGVLENGRENSGLRDIYAGEIDDIADAGGGLWAGSCRPQAGRSLRPGGFGLELDGRNCGGHNRLGDGLGLRWRRRLRHDDIGNQAMRGLGVRPLLAQLLLGRARVGGLHGRCRGALGRCFAGILKETRDDLPLGRRGQLRLVAHRPAAHHQMLGHAVSPANRRFHLKSPVQELIAHSGELAEDMPRLRFIIRIEQRQRHLGMIQIRQPLHGAIAGDDPIVIAGREQHPMRYLAQQRPRLGDAGIGQDQQPAVQIEAQFIDGIGHLPRLEGLQRLGVLLVDDGMGRPVEAHQPELMGIDYHQPDAQPIGRQVPGILFGAVQLPPVQMGADDRRDRRDAPGRGLGQQSVLATEHLRELLGREINAHIRLRLRRAALRPRGAVGLALTNAAEEQVADVAQVPIGFRLVRHT